MRKAEEEGIALFWRKSGGGTVYQDLGNSVWSFFTPIEDFSKTDYKTLNNGILLRALENLGVKATASGRNDIEVDSKKISGSAYKLNLGKSDGSGWKVLHHGTLLIDVDKE